MLFINDSQCISLEYCSFWDTVTWLFKRTVAVFYPASYLLTSEHFLKEIDNFPADIAAMQCHSIPYHTTPKKDTNMELITTFNAFISAPLLTSGENHTDSATAFFFYDQVWVTNTVHCREKLDLEDYEHSFKMWFFNMNHRMSWVGRYIKYSLFPVTLPWTGLPPVRPGCSGLTWSLTVPGTGHPQPSWPACAIASLLSE